MSLHRRTVLAALGSAGLAGGSIAYWQRHRIRRRDEVDDIEAAQDITVPSIDEPLSISTDHVEASYERARTHIEQTESILGPDQPSHSQNQLGRARERLDGHPPEAATSDTERLAALDTYRLATASSSTARGWYYDDETGVSEQLQQLYETLESELDTIEAQYRGHSLTETIVQCGEMDEFHATAASRCSHAQRFLEDDDLANAVVWEIIELARVRLHDVKWFRQQQAGPDRENALTECFEQLAEWTDEQINGIRWEYDGEIRTQAAYRWTETQLGGTDPSEHFAADRPALAVRKLASHAVVAGTLEVFEDVPSEREFAEIDERMIDEAESLQTAKQTAVDEIQTTRSEAGADPLVRYLLEKAIRLIDRGDRRLEHLHSHVRTHSRAEWQADTDRATLRYREAAELARTIPNVVRLIEQ